MEFSADDSVLLDFKDAAEVPKLVENLSGVAVHEDGSLWIASDEGRSVERLVWQDGAYVLAPHGHVMLDGIFPRIPGDENDELDLEAIDVVDGQVWVCGSHCRVRKKPEAENLINPKLRDRPSRHVLVSFDPGALVEEAKSWMLPPEGPGSLRDILNDDEYLAPFLVLPSKENGLDIEGLLVTTDEILLGLRGPVVDNAAVIIRLSRDHETIDAYKLSFLKLGGLAVRDLARCSKGILVLAGPVGEAGGPFRLYLWDGQGSALKQDPKILCTWPGTAEKPEGICVVTRDQSEMLLVVYDSPSNRIVGTTYRADLALLAKLTG